jgi:hypothetical protein
MKKLKLLLSFDHELSLGGAECYKSNLFNPTNKILKLANKIEVPVTLFTDILCAKMFMVWNEERFVKPFIEQLSFALQSNHDVQLHIHPHWIDSEFKDGKYIPSRKYKLSDFNECNWPNNIQGIVKQGIDLLTEICEKHKTDYSCIAYRAGGYNLAPNTETILSSLYDNGIRIDSSVAKGFYFRSLLSEVNYRKMPKKANWFISKHGPIDREADSGLYEVPIAGRPRGTINNFPFLVKRVLYKRRAYESEGKGIHEAHVSIHDKLKRLFPESVWMLGFDNYTDSVQSLMKIINQYVNAHQEDNTIICSTISHPKSMGQYGLSLMERFILKIRQDYGDNVQFYTYRQLYDEMGLKTM